MVWVFGYWAVCLLSIGYLSACFGRGKYQGFKVQVDTYDTDHWFGVYGAVWGNQAELLQI